MSAALRQQVKMLQESQRGLRAELERLRAWQDEVVRGYEFGSADEMLAWVRTLWEEE